MEAYDYYKVSSVAAYASSEDSGQRSLFWIARRKKKSNDFDRLFKNACEDLRREDDEELAQFHKNVN